MEGGLCIEMRIHRSLPIREDKKMGSVNCACSNCHVERTRPHLIVMKVTKQCNLECKYCYESASANKTAKMSYETAYRIVDQLVELNKGELVHILFHGGEPLLCVDTMSAVCSYATENYGGQVSFGIQTNATLITDEVVALIKKYNIIVGISFDGPAITHNITRCGPNGIPSHERVVRGIEKLNDSEIGYGVATVINRTNYKYAKEIIDFYLEYGIHSFAFLPIFPAGRSRENDDLYLEGEELFECYRAAFEYIVEYNQSCFRKEERIRERFLYYLTEQVLCQVRNYKCMNTPCGAGTQLLGADTNGDIYICDDFIGKSEFCLGNVWESSLEKMLAESEVLDQVCNRKVSDNDFCRGCQWQELCGGVCMGQIYNVKMLGLEAPNTCELKKRLIPFLLEQAKKYPDLLDLIGSNLGTGNHWKRKEIEISSCKVLDVAYVQDILQNYKGIVRIQVEKEHLEDANVLAKLQNFMAQSSESLELQVELVFANEEKPLQEEIASCRPTPYVAVLNLTEQCNLECAYCYVGSDCTKKEKMTVETACYIVDDMLELSRESGITPYFIFHGGEPLLCWDTIQEVVSYVESLGQKAMFTMQTNATLLTKEMAEYCKEHRISIGVSIDGPADVHDAVRYRKGKLPSHEKAMRGIQNAYEAGISVGTISVISKKNYMRTAEVMEHLISLGISSFSFCQLLPLGRMEEHPELYVTGEELFESYKQTVDYLIQYNTLHRNDGKHISERTIKHMVRNILTGEKDFMCMRTPCGAGVCVLGFAPDGKVYACDNLVGDERYYLGTVQEQTLSDMLTDHPIVEQLCCRSMEERRRCLECKYKDMCGGLCITQLDWNDEKEHPICEFRKRMIPYLVQLSEQYPNLLQLLG